jgi:hypothetical protein
MPHTTLKCDGHICFQPLRGLVKVDGYLRSVAAERMANRDDMAIRKAIGDPGSCYSVGDTLEDTRKVLPERIATVWQVVDQQVREVPAVV